jgi:hypothetical protein
MREGYAREPERVVFSKGCGWYRCQDRDNAGALREAQRYFPGSTAIDVTLRAVELPVQPTQESLVTGSRNC